MRSLTAKNDVLPEQYVGTDRANLSHFWTANNLVKFSTIKKCSRIPEDHALGYPLVEFQLMMSTHRRDMIICTAQFLKGILFEPLWSFCTSIYTFSKEFWGYESKTKILAFVIVCTGSLQRNKLRVDNSWL